MSNPPLFWNSRYAPDLNLNLFELKIQNGRKFIINLELNSSEILIPGRLTFGGFFPVDNKSVSQDEAYELLTDLMLKFAPKKKLFWKFPPTYFYNHIFKFQSFSVNSIDMPSFCDINQHIDIQKWSSKVLSKGNKKKLKQIKSTDFIFRRASIDDLDKCYDVLEKNRAAIGVKVSMSREEIKRVIIDTSNLYHMHYLELNSEILAMSLTVDLAANVRYVLYWADNLTFRSLSPIVALCEKLIEMAQIDGMCILDLGISSEKGLLNEGLYRFKKNLGALDSNKLTYNFQY